MPRPHCPRCRRPLSHCLCSLIPSLHSTTRVLILQHPSEVTHALNTARLAALGLCNAELRVGEVFEGLAQWLARPGYRPVLLFPGEGAEAAAASSEPTLLVVLDGTWRKARKLLHLNPLLATLPRVALSDSHVSRYRLRKAPGPGALATVEAIALALQALEGKDFSALLRPFEAMIDRQIDAMGTETFQRNHLQPD